MSNTVEEIQIDIDAAREVIAVDDALMRLYKSTDFNEVILKGYFQEEAYRLVELRAAPQMQRDEQKDAILRAIDAIGGLQQHFNKVRAMAEQARMAIQDSEQELEQLAAEGDV